MKPAKTPGNHKNDKQEARAREAVRRLRRKVPQLFSKGWNRNVYRGVMEVADVDTLVAFAREGDKDALDILRKHARGARGARMNVPLSLHEFVWEYFIDGPPRANSGLNPKDMELKHQAIAVMVKIVSRDYGIPEYRNAEHRRTRSGPISACLLVAQELGLDEQWVEEIWADRKASVLRH